MNWAIRIGLQRWLVTLVCALACAPAWGGICRVTVNGDKFNSGSSWAAPTDFATAITSPATCTEIWVAKGVYKPTLGSGRLLYFFASDGVGLYGGFAGTETLREQADPDANLTVLSGDIDNNDSTDAQGRTVDAAHIVGSNSYDVIHLVDVSASTVVDGFTITGGDGGSFIYGGGLNCSGSGVDHCNATLSRLVFMGNTSARGGAIFLKYSGGTESATISHVRFVGNTAIRGGAIYLESSSATQSPTISDATFQGNSAAEVGGAIAVVGASGNPLLTRAAFVGNTANYGGAIHCTNPAGSTGGCTVSVVNGTFIGNHATHTGGALYADSTSGKAHFVLNSVTFNDNQSDVEGGGAIAATNTTGIQLKNSIVWGNRAPLGNQILLYPGSSATTDHSVVGGSGGSSAWKPAFGTDGGGNIDIDPKLVASYQLGAPQSISPSAGSPAIDAADDATCPADDQRGVVRPQAAHCDMGAVETFPVDLIGHKGLEACWSGAQTKTAFLGMVRSQIEGAVTCAAPVINGTFAACTTPACPGSVAGCPLTTRSGTFAGSFGDGNFTATGGVDNTTVSVYVNALNKYCSYDVTNLTATYGPSYVFTEDGNLGDYAALLQRFTLTAHDGYTISSTDQNCQNIAGPISSAIVSLVQATLQANLDQKLRDATLGKAVCPLSP